MKTPNAGGEPLPEAGAQRTLEAVGSTALFGSYAAAAAANGKELLGVLVSPPASTPGAALGKVRNTNANITDASISSAGLPVTLWLTLE
jgi:hypothetical protein